MKNFHLLKLFLFCFCAMLIFHAGALDTNVRRVGFWYLPGYHEQNADGNRSGYGYAYMEKIAACMGWQIQYIGYDKSWAELLDMLENGKIDLLTSATKTPAREIRFDYADRPIGFSFTILTVRSGDNRYKPNDYANWNGMRIGMIRESSRNKQFETFAASKGFCYKPHVYQTYVELEQALANRSVDALLSTNSRRIKNEWILEKINPDPVYIIVKKGNKKLLKSINMALSVLDINEPNLNEILILRYYSSNIAKSIPMTATESEFLKNARLTRRSFRVLIKPDRRPLGMYQNGEMRGIFRDIADLIRKRSTLNLRIVPCRTRAEYEGILRHGKYDIIFDTWRSYHHAGNNGFYLTEPYYTSSVSLLQLKQRGAKTGKKGVFRNSWMWYELQKKGISPAKLVCFDSTEDMIKAIREGVVDSGYMHTQMASLAINDDKSSQLTAQIAYGLQMEYAIGIKRTLPPELVRILGKAVRSISDDEMLRIVSAYDIPPTRRITLIDWFAANPLKTFFVIFCILFTIICLLVFILISRRKIYRTGKVITRLPVRFFVSDKEGNILLYNAPDVEHSRFPWRKISDMDSPEITEIMYKAVAEAFKNDVFTVDYVYDGMRRTARTERLSQRIFGRKTVIWISQNTEELQASKEQLQRALKQARSAEKAKSFFLATMSHEIRTPLNAVIGFTELLKNDELPPEVRKDYLSDISSAGNALLALINDVLDLSKLEAEQMEFVSVETDLPTLLNEVVSVFKPLCQNKKLEISVSVPPMPHVFVDHLRIRQILFNLIGNAVKFTEYGRVSIFVSFLRERNEKGTLVLSVSDTGRGISVEDQKMLFQPFVQSKAMRGTQTANNGTGLGLAIIQRMIQRMNGNIVLKSAPGKGSEFTVTLHGIPFKQPGAEKPSEPENDDTPDQGNTKYSVLLIDDVAMNLKVENAMLKKLGMNVFPVSTAKEAFGILNSRRIDFILTDLWMPVTTGDELAKEVRSDHRFDNIKIVAVTADSESRSCFDMTVFDRILTKPVTSGKLKQLFSSMEKR